MFSILAAFIFSVIVVLCILLICGLPLGEFTMGGQNKVLPKSMRFLAIIMLILQIFAIIIVLQCGGHIMMWFPRNITRTICYIYAGYMILNSIMCFFSKSKKEKYVMTPLAFVAGICFFITAWNMPVE